MAKINETYEAMVVFSLKQGEDGIKALTEKFKGMMAEAGTVESVDEWARESLLTRSTIRPRATTFSTHSHLLPISPQSLTVYSRSPRALCVH